jgi:hypothetical protein
MGWMLRQAPTPGFEKRSDADPGWAGETPIIPYSGVYAPLIPLALAGGNTAD